MPDSRWPGLNPADFMRWHDLTGMGAAWFGIRYWLTGDPCDGEAFVTFVEGAVKQLVGFGSFEVRRYIGLMRHWLCSRIAVTCYYLGSSAWFWLDSAWPARFQGRGA